MITLKPKNKKFIFIESTSLFLMKFHASTFDESHHLLVKSLVKISML